MNKNIDIDNFVDSSDKLSLSNSSDKLSLSNSSDKLSSSNSNENTDNNSISEHSSSNLQIILNCSLHVTILFFFLYLLFIFLIEPISQNAFKNEFNHIITGIFNNIFPTSNNISNIVMNDSNLDNLISNMYPDYNSLDLLVKSEIRMYFRELYLLLKNNTYIFKNYLRQYSSINYLIEHHNNDIHQLGIAINVFLIFITVSLCCYFKYFYPNDINLTKLFIENIITFIFIGLGEYWFFTTYIINYIPAAPSLLSKSAIDKIKERLLRD
jgi:hypothetical protein